MCDTDDGTGGSHFLYPGTVPGSEEELVSSAFTGYIFTDDGMKNPLEESQRLHP